MTGILEISVSDKHNEIIAQPQQPNPSQICFTKAYKFNPKVKQWKIINE